MCANSIDTRQINLIKDEILIEADKKIAEFIEISHAIFTHPELGCEEYKAAALLAGRLKRAGFGVQRGIGCFETGFVASYDSDGVIATREGLASDDKDMADSLDTAPLSTSAHNPSYKSHRLGRHKTIAFIAEYDALKDLGHACGHNLISTSSIMAAILLRDAIRRHGIEGRIEVIGTPAEESIGAKVDFIKLGVFDGIDAAMMLHPADASMSDDISFACAHMRYSFHGRAAHSAAGPWLGRSALSGVIELFNMSNALRLHLRDYTRLHGIVESGGSVDNIIPAFASCIFNIRALELEELEKMIEKMTACAQAAALATGTKVTVEQVGNLYMDVQNAPFLVDTLEKNFAYMGEATIKRAITQGIGSTDMGNVTHTIPALHAYIGLYEGAVTHTLEFAKASGGIEGESALLRASKALALCGLDVLVG